jgi:hypothetical protein
MKTSDKVMAALIVLGMAGAMAGIIFTAPKRAVVFSVETPPVEAAVAFDSFGPGHAFGTNFLGVGDLAHGDWFVPARSGPLSALELAIESSPQEPGSAEVFLARDSQGFPGATMESYVVAPRGSGPASNSVPAVIVSVAQPVLESGVKYWLCVRGGGWVWHFNNQDLAQKAARETGRNQWASAGDYCYCGAFRVLVRTNQLFPRADY